MNFGDGASSIYLDCSADDLVPYNTGDPDLLEVYTNSLVNTNSYVYGYFWNKCYTVIYQCNASIEGLNESTTLNDSTKKEFIGEATFLRDLMYFYLINIFGDVPYVISASGWQQTESATRMPVANVYEQLINDLKLCQVQLKADYSMALGERTRATQEAASALLARIYLYKSDWADAIAQSTSVIENGLFSLVQPLANVFSANNSEAILQWDANTTYFPGDATTEGYNVLPSGSGQPPNFYLSTGLQSAFEAGDGRWSAWVDSVNVNGTMYYYPNKYTVSSGTWSEGGTASQYYVVLRLAEQYLIRAEAEINTGNLASAVTDINVIRTRAGLPVLNASLTQAQVMTALMNERRIEFFAEWGHRWLDLKRADKIDSVMSVVTPSKNGGGDWKTTQKLYPIPLAEIQADPNLTQNPGY